jgi:predicted transposase YdaD
MKKPYDATTRTLFEMGPPDWAGYLGSPLADPRLARVIDSNLSTIVAEADKVLWIDAPEPWIEHVELQAGRDIRLIDRGHLYNTILGYQFRVPIRTSLVLLRPAADGPELTGVREQKHRNGDVYDAFRYNLIRVWEQPVDQLLACGLTVLPLAPVSMVEPEKVPDVLRAIADCLAREASPDQAATLWSATRILMGLRYEKEQIDAMIEGVSAMLFGIHGIEESTVYQGIFRQGETKGRIEGRAEGVVEHARATLLRQGCKKLGPPGERMAADIAAMDHADRLNDLLDRVLDVSTWDELMASPDR